MRKTYDLEKLLEIAESADEPSYIEKKLVDVDKYIKQFNIQAGDVRVPAKVIYHHYRKWRKQKYISRIWFFRQFSKIFEKGVLQKEVAYYLNPEPYDLSLESKARATAFLRKEQHEKKKKSKS